MTFDKALESHKQKMSERETEYQAEQGNTSKIKGARVDMKQQEYQEALNHISELAEYIRNESSIKPYKDKLQELVDKETPMKPIEYDGQIPWISYNCPNCLWTISSVMKESYCETCGQKIDWSDEE